MMAPSLALTDPLSYSSVTMMHFKRVVFPAPLAPTSPILSPDFTSNVTFSNTVFIPNAFDNPLIFKVAISLPLMKNQEI